MSIKMKSVPKSLAGYFELGKYWDSKREEIVIGASEYNSNSQFQNEMLSLFQRTEMTEQGRKWWVLRMEESGETGSYDVILFQAPFTGNSL